MLTPEFDERCARLARSFEDTLKLVAAVLEEEKAQPKMYTAKFMFERTMALGRGHGNPDIAAKLIRDIQNERYG